MDTNLTKEKSNQTTRTTQTSIGLVLWVVLQVGLFASIRGLIHFNPRITASTLFLVSRIFFWCCLFAIWLYAVRVERLPLLLWKEKRLGTGNFIVSVIVLLIVAFLGSAIVAILLKMMGLLQQSPVIKWLLAMSLPLKLFAVISAGVIEELYFRAYLMSRLQLYFKGPWPGIILSALVFGLVHAGFGTIVNLIVPFYIGLLFGWYYKQYRNIKVLIICHFLIDLISLVIFPSLTHVIR
jgi:membrane protease YdiL (CAAX protease family)